jgi:hypothetical protein
MTSRLPHVDNNNKHSYADGRSIFMSRRKFSNWIAYEYAPLLLVDWGGDALPHDVRRVIMHRLAVLLFNDKVARACVQHGWRSSAHVAPSSICALVPQCLHVPVELNYTLDTLALPTRIPQWRNVNDCLDVDIVSVPRIFWDGAAVAASMSFAQVTRFKEEDTSGYDVATIATEIDERERMGHRTDLHIGETVVQVLVVLVAVVIYWNHVS